MRCMRAASWASTVGERSLSGRRWEARLEDARLAEAISQRHELPDILGRVLAARRSVVVVAQAGAAERVDQPFPEGKRALGSGLSHNQQTGIAIAIEMKLRE